MKIFSIPLVLILVVVAGRTLNAGAQTVTTVYSFNGSPTDGSQPYAGLVQSSDGNFYGTTEFGGSSGSGTVFQVSLSGSYTSLYSFGSSSGDGSRPYAGLVQGSDGNFYGTTLYGGTHSSSGTVFRISSSGNYTNLYSFGSSPIDGRLPSGGLVQGSDGNFYGTTSSGGTGTNNIPEVAGGTVYRISPSGTYTSLYSFGSSLVDGFAPSGGLVQGSDGNFYGTTGNGGTNIACGCGTVYRISPSGAHATLYSFNGYPSPDGYYPKGSLVQGSDGNFYGTTGSGGTNGNGTVFRISPSGSYTSLYTFAGSPGDGSTPWAGLVQGSDGNFYGTTYNGGPGSIGTVFRISPNGNETNLYSFTGYVFDGRWPSAVLVQGSDGNFYGTTTAGGGGGSGTVFEMIVPLNPPANQVSRIQLAGTNVVLAVPSVAGETYQLQFSSSMNPTNWVNVPSVSVTNSLGALLTMTNFGAASSHGFYRFDITP
jgi:uncharacterized repeat protein (TIGR03803 family)